MLVCRSIARNRALWGALLVSTAGLSIGPAHAQTGAEPSLDPYFYVARAADPVAAVTDEFVFHEASATNSMKVMRLCLPHQSATAFENFAKSWKPHEGAAGSTGSLVVNLRGAPILVFDKTRIACLPRAVAGHVVFPAAAFRLALVMDVEDSVQRQWTLQVARTLAAQGFATVRFELTDGTSQVVEFSSDVVAPIDTLAGTAATRTEPGTLRYRLMGAEAPANVSLSFKHPSLGRLFLRPYRNSFRLTALDSTTRPNVAPLP
jgi:hypothetical protein